MKKKHITQFLLLSTLTALVIYGINKFIFYSSCLKNLVSDQKGSYYQWRFGNVYYEIYGSGSPILLIHDLNESSSSYEWNELVDSLSKTNTVYVIDLLGCGRSEKTNITYTNFLYVQLISDFIKNIIKHKTDIIATGLSSSFVITACHNNPELFNKLLFINPIDLKRLSISPGKRSKTLKFLINTPIIGTLIYNMLTSKYFIKKDFEKTYFYNELNIFSKDINVYYEASHKSGALSKFLFSSIKGHYMNLNITHALKQINNSIYLIGGMYLDSIQDIFADYLDYNSSIETSFVEDSKFLPQLEEPKKLLEQIQIYLNDTL